MTDTLHTYNQKRDFTRTPEPEGIEEKPEQSLRFVVQHHIASKVHYDFRLEWEGVLLSWAIPKGPSYNTRDKRLAVQVEEHPLEYRNFEGTIPKGEYGGGIVMLWDEGYWEPNGSVESGLSEGMLKFVLHGKRLKGKWALVRLKPKERETKNNWLLLKEKDDYAKSDDGISEYTTSIRTGRTMPQIEEGKDNAFLSNPFDKTDVQLAKLVKDIPKGDDWLYELKYDGYRILAYVEGSNVKLITRNGKDYTSRFLDVANSLSDMAAGRSMVLDGEMTVTDALGKTDFQALQNYLKNPGKQNLTYIMFDLLALDGEDLRAHRLIDRKEKLEALMEGAPKNLFYSRHVRGAGKESFTAACNLKMEGIVGKKANSPYSGTRNGDWIKLKCDFRQEFVIGGYTRSDERADGVSSLLLGIYEENQFIYAGRAGTGLSDHDRKELETKFESLKTAQSHFLHAPKPRSDEQILWLIPKLVAEVKFAEWTEDNLLRQASFKGLRTDKNPLDVKRESESEEEPEAIPGGAPDTSERIMEKNTGNIIIEGIRITHPDKVLFDNPIVTKKDVAMYYASVSKRMLPYVSRRILSIVRCPKGITSSCFFKKHPGTDSHGIVIYPIVNSEGETEDYFYVEDTSGLVGEAQMGTLEFHTWGSRADALEKPDMMVFDLDPDEGMDLDTVRQGVLDIRNILTELSLNSFLKTSGGKGYHVVVPLKPAASWDVFYDFARRVAEVMELKWPDRYTSNSRKSKRTNKIFIDYIRNGRGATSIAPYSIRARNGATVSMPIAWEELNTIAPDGIRMADALIRLQRDDPWSNFFLQEQLLK